MQATKGRGAGSEVMRLYTTTRWRRGRLSFLARNPLCAQCERSGRLTVARCVDHIVPHKGNERLFFDVSNWQALCFNCHNSHKQSTERRGYDSTPNVDGSFSDPRHPFNKPQGGGEGSTK
jgi:5-methylcytosine-specific restriction protein A